MEGAEVIDRADQVHSGVQDRLPPGQGTDAPHQGEQPSAEGGVEPFDVGGVEEVSSPARETLREVRLRPLQQASLDRDDPPLISPL